MFNPDLNSRIITSRAQNFISYPPVVTQPSVRRPFTYKCWEDISMQKAVAAVETTGLSIRKASELYNVPKSSLHDRVTGKVKVNAKPGRDPYLTSGEEAELVNFIINCSKVGYGHTRKQILSLVQSIINDKGIEMTVSSGWWERFKQRHPQLTLRVPAPISLSRAVGSDSEIFDNYFSLLEETLKANDIYDKPANLFNFDETGLPLNPKSLKIACSVGSKNPSYLTNNCRSQITVLACTSAAGYCIPPFVIFDRKTLNPEMTQGEVPGTLYGLSQNGWIDKELFSDWFFCHFLAFAPPIRPLLLLMDGHSTHYCPDVIKEAAEQKVIVFVLPPNTTHLSQPLDKGPFSPLKVAYRQMCHEFMCNNPGRQITRYDFSKIFSSAWYSAMTMRNIMSGFKTTGVCPFNKNIFQIQTNQYTSFKSDTLPERTGLAYIPFYSPRQLQTSTKSVISPTFLPGDGDCCYLSDDSDSGDQEELEQCDTMFDCVYMNPVKSSTSISKHLNIPMSPKKILKTEHSKNISGRVLTSNENIQMMEQKEEIKKEKKREKEEKQKLREEKQRKTEIEKDLKARSTRGKQMKFNNGKSSTRSIRGTKPIGDITSTSSNVDVNDTKQPDEVYLPQVVNVTLHMDRKKINNCSKIQTRSSKRGTKPIGDITSTSSNVDVNDTKQPDEVYLPPVLNVAENLHMDRKKINNCSKIQTRSSKRGTKPIGGKIKCSTVQTRSSKRGTKPIGVSMESDEWWLRSMNLNTTEHHSVINGECLSDRIITAALSLLKQQFPYIDGFQCSLLGEKLKFIPISQNMPFVQIIYTGCYHWICISSNPFTPKSPKICVFDSLGLLTQLTSSTILQIANLVNTSKQSFKVEKIPVQQQQGLKDCALFALAFAMELCIQNVKDIETVCFDQKKMRTHLCDCLEDGKMTPFPKLGSFSPNVVRSSYSLLKISVYCLCRLPDIYDDDMIKCDSCKKWYHYKCVALPIGQETADYWSCSFCN